jgi:hypothetical protein
VALARGDTNALKEHIVALYCARHTCRQIADLTGLSYPYVRDSLKESGIKLGGRPTGPRVGPWLEQNTEPRMRRPGTDVGGSS